MGCYLSATIWTFFAVTTNAVLLYTSPNIASVICSRAQLDAQRSAVPLPIAIPSTFPKSISHFGFSRLLSFPSLPRTTLREACPSFFHFQYTLLDCPSAALEQKRVPYHQGFGRAACLPFP